ncbi:hypothetical protein C5167_044584 [Papaver somniferum]|uniref:E2F/DP family winged-helix DNA-binding domain-containing protein n=1 Tax=Papaver somniferum TaxID=3469 RepID=A0A4Y7LCU6_PAPSO|nr:transcription factor-like protein DPB [Papaver somniferum]RZC82015.1 hypothetical protein C5167_044584 [Papaver somniferum]
MVIKGTANQQNGGCSSVSGGAAAAASGGGGKSMSRTSGSVGSSPSSKTLNRLNHLDIQAADDDAGKKKKKKIVQTRAVAAGGGGDNKTGGGRGLRQFSVKVCEKVEAKGRTTYNEVADELVAEFSTQTPDNPQNFEEKNIRRRVYDALNVLMAMDIITKDENKEIIWRGLPRAGAGDELKAESLGLRNRIATKAAYLKELEDQFVGLQNLRQRNEQMCCSGSAAATAGGVPLPFILVQTRPHATVEVEISEDMQLVHFDFNTTPFEIHDDSFVLKSMGLCDSSPEKNNICTQESASNGGEGSNIGSNGMYQKTPQVDRRLLPVSQEY